MDAQRWQRLQELFLEAHSLQGEERERRLAEACRGDPELLAELSSLLAVDAAPGVLDLLGPRLASVAEVLSNALPARIGAYRIIRELGRGGMGVVFLAERVDGQFQHRAAIKLIGATDADDPLHQRFLAERQILAGLQHPNIARLLDGGITDDGRPYLVLEYVDGLPITTYCDRHRLGIEERLRLFLDVCAAVQHAHQNLVIHRDLKPSNILVTTGARVHLLDFGIAKLLNPALSAADAPVTRVELRAMTPEYASPEQVRGDSLTTASDIYSLGVLLYELLCGSPPYRLATHSPLEVAEAVCEQDPERPSTRITRSESRPAASGERESLTPEQRSATRNTSIERLRRQLQGDLDSIVLMALRKEPGRRYASADLLRQDIVRYLEGLPVLAHRGSRRYRIGKLVRRHRVEAVAALLVLISLLAGLGAALWQGRLAGRERDRADRARADAEQALAQSEEVTEFLMELFRAGESDSGLPSTEVTALDLLQRGSVRAHELADQPVVQARLLDVIGQMLLHLGRYDEAQRQLEQAVAIRRAVLGADAPDLATSLIHLSWVHRSRSDLQRARPLVDEALEIRRRTLPPDHSDLAEAYYEAGWLAGGTRQEGLYTEALRILQRSGAAPDRQVEILHALSTNLRRQGRLAQAVAADREALRLAEQEFGPEHAQTGYAMIHLGDHVRDIEGDVAAAERLFRRGLELMTRRFGENSIRLRHGLHSLGDLLSQRGQHAEAEQLFRRSLAIRLAATGPEHPSVADVMQSVARELARQGRLQEAEAMARDALARSQRALGARHPAVTNARLPVLAEILERQGRHAEADRAFREAIETSESGPVVLGQLHREYGRMLLRRGEYPQAETLLRESLALLEGAYGGADHPNVQETKRALMELYAAWGKPEFVERYRVPPGRFVPH